MPERELGFKKGDVIWLRNATYKEDKFYGIIMDINARSSTGKVLWLDTKCATWFLLSEENAKLGAFGKLD
jgi:hypothetical protein